MDTEAKRQQYKYWKVAEKHLLESEADARAAAAAMEKADDKLGKKMAENIQPIIDSLENFRKVVTGKANEAARTPKLKKTA